MDELMCEHGFVALACGDTVWFPAPCPTCESSTVAGVIDRESISLKTATAA